MRINRILNNNAVVVKEGNQEKIVMGPGIAFQKKKNDVIPNAKIEKIFVMNEGNEKFQELLRTLPEEVISLAEEIISHAEGQLQVPLSDHIHISLTDHLSFAIERLKEGIDVQNKLLHEIKSLYTKEYQIGLWARDLIQERIGLTIPEDEAGHIALHIHTAKLGSSMENTVKQTTMLNEIVELLEKELDTEIDKDGISHQRMITHLRFAITRVEDGVPFHDMDEDMLKLIQSKYEQAFSLSEKLAQFLKQEYQYEFPLSEIGYIALHIQRIIDRI
ncbi:levansucrase [Pontibacillus halophilus JSM 076056 = DSM 19796]|uniref:Levansucrase n=1 Tax=Pontibacillus halophilus JSM 076056 = DSM 19796 TaxID=1385510 RepID=A0A0A5GRA8_9BACI|nr:PRD domain-containing protein [Pontibacillus halophilus]KGX93793.1 levansucrase [Pontibacillus halophilus JSM 076056 = DSM 19796]